MSTHLSAWFQSVDQAALGRINFVQDGILTPSGTQRFLVPSDYRWLHWIAALGLNITRAQLVTPSLDVRRMNLEIIPRVEGAVAFELTSLQAMQLPRPLELRASETMEAQTGEDGAGATAQYMIAALGPQSLPAMPAGEIRMVRATGTTTLTANVWTTVPLTLDTSLEPGRYRLVHFVPNSATGICARAIITGQNYRPGMPCTPGAEDVAMDFNQESMEKLGFYDMGEFTHINVPSMQFLASAADTAERVFLYIIRTGDL